MFDPAWREDDTVGSRGKHPMAIINRSDCTPNCVLLSSDRQADHAGRNCNERQLAGCFALALLSLCDGAGHNEWHKAADCSLR